MIKYCKKAFTLSASATGNSPQTFDFDVEGASVIAVLAKTTGTNLCVPTLLLYGSPDDRTTLFEMPLDQVMKAGNVPTINQRLIIGAAISASAEFYVATIKWPPCQKMRLSLAWTTQPITADVWVIGMIESPSGRI